VSPGSPFRDRAATRGSGQPSRRGEQGTITLEAVLIYPLVLLIAWVGMQLALVHLANRVALASAEEAASAARARAGTVTAAEQRAHRYLGVLGTGLLATPTVQIVRTVDTVTVQVSGQAQRIVPGFPVHVTQAVHSPTERFRGASRGFRSSPASLGANSRAVGSGG
jgi:hypothetical protein